MPMPPTSPSSTVLATLRRDLMQFAPFAQMSTTQVDRLLAASTQAYFAPGETVLSPADGPLAQLWIVRQGNITATGGEDGQPGALELESGDLFPVAAFMAARPADIRYEARTDTFCLAVPGPVIHALAAESAALSRFLTDRLAQLLVLSQQALQVASVAKDLAEQALESPLTECSARSPVAVSANTPIGQALALMQGRQAGSVVVIDAQQMPCGILTRHDVLGRVALAQVALTEPVSQVMSAPVHSLPDHASGHEAALLMARHGVRHIPLTQAGRLVGIVSERDLFKRQQLSIRSVGADIRRATTLGELPAAAQRIRDLAARLLAQGISAAPLTELISQLNDALTQRLVALKAEQLGLDLRRACWLAFGSEGRCEQTIATDQDNGIVFESDRPEHERAQWLTLGREVNAALDTCGYPLCKGNVMAANPACCLSPAEWCSRFTQWIDHGAPSDLLKASIYFDLRPLVGNLALAHPLQALLVSPAARIPRFLKQLADNALQRHAPLTWFGAIDTRHVDGVEQVDLKLQGSALFTDAARLYALAHGIAETNTRRRLSAIGAALGVAPNESQAWGTAFEFLQMLRLRAQVRVGTRAPTDRAANPNLITPAQLDDVDRRVLKTCFQVLRGLQQRLAMDYAS